MRSAQGTAHVRPSDDDRVAWHRRPLMYWWLPVAVLTPTAIAFDWSTSRALLASLTAAALLLVVDVAVSRRRQRGRRRLSERG